MKKLTLAEFYEKNPRCLDFVLNENQLNELQSLVLQLNFNHFDIYLSHQLGLRLQIKPLLEAHLFSSPLQVHDIFSLVKSGLELQEVLRNQLPAPAQLRVCHYEDLLCAIEKEFKMLVRKYHVLRSAFDASRIQLSDSIFNVNTLKKKLETFGLLDGEQSVQDEVGFLRRQLTVSQSLYDELTIKYEAAVDAQKSTQRDKETFAQQLSKVENNVAVLEQAKKNADKKIAELNERLQLLSQPMAPVFQFTGKTPSSLGGSVFRFGEHNPDSDRQVGVVLSALGFEASISEDPIKKLASENQLLLQQLQALKEENVSLRSQLALSPSSLKKKPVKTVDSTEVSLLKEKIKDLEEQLIMKRDDLAESLKSVEASHQACRTVSSECARLELENKNMGYMRVELEKKERVIVSLRFSITELQTQIEGFQRGVRKSIHDSQVIVGLKQERDILRKNSNGLLEKMRKADEACARLRDELLAAQRRCEELSSDIKQLEASREPRLNSYDSFWGQVGSPMLIPRGVADIWRRKPS